MKEETFFKRIVYFYWFLAREWKGEGERTRNVNQLSPAPPRDQAGNRGMYPDGNWTSNLWVRGATPNQPSHMGRGGRGSFQERGIPLSKAIGKGCWIRQFPEWSLMILERGFLLGRYNGNCPVKGLRSEWVGERQRKVSRWALSQVMASKYLLTSVYRQRPEMFAVETLRLLGCTTWNCLGWTIFNVQVCLFHVTQPNIQKYPGLGLLLTRSLSLSTMNSKPSRMSEA